MNQIDTSVVDKAMVDLKTKGEVEIVGRILVHKADILSNVSPKQELENMTCDMEEFLNRLAEKVKQDATG